MLRLTRSLLVARPAITPITTSFHLRSFSSSAKILRAANKPAEPTDELIKHVLTFSSKPSSKEPISAAQTAIVNPQTITSGCKGLRMGNLGAYVVAEGFSAFLDANGAPHVAPKTCTAYDAAKYGLHGEGAGFFRPGGNGRLAEILKFCVTIDGKEYLFKSDYETYVNSLKLYRKMIEPENIPGLSCLGKLFGGKAANGEESITFSTYAKKYVGKMKNPNKPDAGLEECISADFLKQVVKDTRVVRENYESASPRKNP